VHLILEVSNISPKKLRGI